MAGRKASKWSAKVKTHWSPPEGLFTKSAETIANALDRESDDCAQATERLNFYINRAGKNLSKSDRARLEAAKQILHYRCSIGR